MPRDLIIDGYNLMHAAGLARDSYAPGVLERCRLRLLTLVAGLLDEMQREHTTIVFDAKDAPAGGSRQDMFQGILIEYSPPGQEADDVIELLIRQHSAPKQLLVVSSDHRLHKAARRRRAHARDSDRFLDDCERRARKRTASTPDLKPEEDLSPAMLEAWLTAFGDIDPAAIRAEVAAKEPQRPIAPPATDQSPLPPKPPAVTEPDMPEIPEDEVKFWERRVSELFDE